MPAFTKPRGRPPALTRVVRQTRDGKDVTVADAIVEAIRAGSFIESAAAANGVNKATLHDWLRTGSRVQQRLLNDGARRGDFTRKELLCAEFSDAVGRAFAEATTIEVATAAQLARGGITETETITRTETLPQGPPKVTTTTKQKVLAPDGAMIRWRLSKREPDTWGRERLELTGPDGGPVELSLVEKRQRLLEGLEVLADKLASAPDDLLTLVPSAPPEETPDAPE